MLANTDENVTKERRYLDVAVAERLAGVVLSPASSASTTIDVLQEAGIPLVSFDEEPWTQAYRPSMTVIAQPTYQIGQRAAQLLLERINNPALTTRHLSLPATLQIRQSSHRGARPDGVEAVRPERHSS